MNCAQAEELLQARLDGELQVEQAIELGLHLGQCQVCHALLCDMERLNTIVVQLPDHPAEGYIARSVLKAMQPAPDAVHTSRTWHWSFVAASAMLLVVVLAARFIPLNPLTVASVEPSTYADHCDPPAVRQQPEFVSRQEKPVDTDPTIIRTWDDDDLVSDLHVQIALARRRKNMALTEQERAKQKRRAALLNDLQVARKAGTAATELIRTADPEGRDIWIIASAVTHPTVGVEIFEAVTALEPRLFLAPIYIAALDSNKTRQPARAILCALSGQRYEAQPDIWLAWWTIARAKSPQTKSTKNGNG
jgi:hypothetical protein